MKTIHVLGSVMILVVLISALVSLCGIWGLIPGDTAWQVVFSALVVSGGVLGANEVLKNFFKDKLL